MIPIESRLDEVLTGYTICPSGASPRRRRISVIGAIRVSRFASCLILLLSGVRTVSHCRNFQSTGQKGNEKDDARCDHWSRSSVNDSSTVRINEGLIPYLLFSHSLCYLSFCSLPALHCNSSLYVFCLWLSLHSIFLFGISIAVLY